MKIKNILIAVLFASTGGFIQAQGAQQVSHASVVPGNVAQHWIANEEDNIVGITDLSKVSRPARVDYDALMKATPQMQEIRRRHIDPNSPEGKAFRKGARTLITKRCESARRSGGYCSVWKSITSSDGRAAPDITDRVLDLLEG